MHTYLINYIKGKIRLKVENECPTGSKTKDFINSFLRLIIFLKSMLS